jgi:hypothetical protein
MSIWRRKAIEVIPELKQEFEQPETSIYMVFAEILPKLVEAHQTGSVDRIKNIHLFAKWCFRQKAKDLWNSAGVSFYEHLGDHEETRTTMNKWVSHDVYIDIRSLLQARLSEEKLREIDQQYR